MDDDQEDTGRHDTRDMELDLLSKIHDKLVGMEERLKSVEDRMETLIRDVDLVHKFQQSFAERLSIVEKFCVEQPLGSVPSTGKGI